MSSQPHLERRLYPEAEIYNHEHLIPREMSPEYAQTILHWQEQMQNLAELIAQLQELGVYEAALQLEPELQRWRDLLITYRERPQQALLILAGVDPSSLNERTKILELDELLNQDMEKAQQEGLEALKEVGLDAYMAFVQQGEQFLQWAQKHQTLTPALILMQYAAGNTHIRTLHELLSTGYFASLASEIAAISDAADLSQSAIETLEEES